MRRQVLGDEEDDGWALIATPYVVEEALKGHEADQTGGVLACGCEDDSVHR